ncbi:MAG: sodium-dependent transporter [Gammaproteobacteria bacterium]|nr:sodium-dependent transporter [Gammaproteobacteria bacterium]
MTTTGGMHWSSKFTFIMAAVGCAVGLGNIWLFPYTAGVSGGGAFVLIYLAAVVVLALPVLMAELLIGRRGAAGPPAAIAAVAKESGHSENWRWMGVVLGGGGAIIALAFYGVVGGWTMAYAYKMAAGQLQQIDAQQSQLIFDRLNGEPGSLLPWFTAFFAATVLISARGLQAGIEKAVKFMMPALFLMLVAMVIYAAVVGDFARAVNFLFAPDFSKVDSQVVLRAFGQAFFSVSVGITNMMAYGAYIERSTKLPSASAIVVGADTAVALLAGLAIFPIIFAYGLEPGAGEGLVFMTLPFAFGQIPGGLVFGTVFFVLLFFAALTSSIGMLEAPVSWLRDATKLSRRSAALLAGSISFVLGLFAALSFSVLSDFHPLGAISIFEGKRFFEVFIYLVTSVLMPIGGILVAVFAGWLMQRQFSRDELFEGKNSLMYRAWLIIVRFIAPAILAFVLIDVARG